MHVDYLILADAVANASGKLYIHGTGWDTVVTPAFPVQPRMDVALQLRVPSLETNEPHTVELDVVDEDGRSVMPDPPGPFRGTLNVSRLPHAIPGEDQLVPIAINLEGLSLQHPGRYFVVLRIDGAEFTRTAFRANQKPASQQVAG